MPAPITPRCTEAEADARVLAVLGKLRRMTPRVDILRFASETWGIGERQAETYLSRAYRILRAETEQEAAEHAAQIVDARKGLILRLYSELDAATDPDEVVSITGALNTHLRSLEKLLALHATDRAALARAGLDKALAEAGLAASAEELRAVLAAGASSRAERGLDDDTRDDEAEYVTLEV